MKQINQGQLTQAFKFYEQLTEKSRYNRWLQSVIEEGYIVKDTEGNLYYNKVAADMMASALHLKGN
jgi:hypothetical protein